MGDGIRPKGRKSFAATRSEEAAEAYRKDRQPEHKCPKCGSEKPMNPWFDYCFDCTLKVAHQRRGRR
jgi:hypothetical protein